MDSPLEEHGPGWTVDAGPTNSDYGRLIEEQLRLAAPLIMRPRGEGGE